MIYILQEFGKIIYLNCPVYAYYYVAYTFSMVLLMLHMLHM